jgi:cytochrome o ubiquinol oxidase subunit 3
MRSHPGINIERTNPELDIAAGPIMFGFWLFLMSDLVIFSLLLATYASMSVHGIAGGPAPSDFKSLGSAALETGLLLLSSFTFGMASLALKYRKDTGRLIWWLAVTFVLGAGFVAFEARDFASQFAIGWTPQRSGYLSARFTLLGVHGIHVIAGLCWIVLSIAQVVRTGIDRGNRFRIMRLALFWHLLDIVWVAIFTFVFLFGMAA